jgi:very-short-patch-repair endonuclease
LPFIQREMAKQRNIAPLRKTLQHAEATVRAIKPCFLMSPLTVAQYLGGKAPSFDLVIFDEASQLPSEDAVGAIARGHQLVVVGDPKQLPPTNFFSISGTANAPLGDDGLPMVEDAESVLEEYMGAGVPVTRLKWHYRSAHESLISFSNVSFYDADLYTFPSVDTSSDTKGLSFEYIADGVYEGKGLNMAEARRVVDAVVRHAKERPYESLGVGTFNMRQQLAILDELELRRREDPSIEPFFSRGAGEPFFVKNLENIQGDERDVIFLSVTYAKGPDGRLRYNFGPINGENGWRRLNVLTTRARKRMRVFSSMRGDDINAAATTSRGALLLRDFLRFAEFGRLESVVANASAATESPFEHQVVSELTRRGIKVVPQVGVAGYRIDIGVLDDDVAGRFVCGIECDGVAYHSAETARDRDRLRQQVLEARGWTIVRVWSTDWFKDRSGQIERLTNLIARAKEEAKQRLVADAEAEVRTKALAEVERQEAEQRAARADVQAHARVQSTVAAGPYVRPTAPAYRFAGGQGRYVGQDFLETSTSFVMAAIVEIVNIEAPVHVDDLSSRVAGMWGLARVGSRISAKIQEALGVAARSGGVVPRGDFVWTAALAQDGAKVPVRSRSGTRISGERVPVEEVREAIALVLRAAGGLSADELFSDVRQVLGVGRSGLTPTFEEALGTLVKHGTVGEGSAGFALRG